MDIKQAIKDSAKSAKFEGAVFSVRTNSAGRLEVNCDLTASIDLPGDMDQIVANIAGMLGVGNSPQPSPPSAP